MKILLKRLLFTVMPVFIVFTNAVSAEKNTNKEKVYKIYESFKNRFAGVNEISPDEAMKLFKSEEAIFVDVRSKKEMDVSMLPDAVPEKEFNTENNTKKKIIAYCTIGYRSARYAVAMKKKGITVFNLKAGILAWVHEGGQVADSKGPVKRVHVYGWQWDLLPQEYKSVKPGFLDRFIN